MCFLKLDLYHSFSPDICQHIHQKTLTHIDFLTISQSTEIVAKISLSIINETNNADLKKGNTLSRNLTEIELKFLPKDMPDSIEIDIANLNVGESIHIADIKLPSNVSLATELTDDNNQPVVAITKAKTIAETEESAETSEDSKKDAET